jgi:hypothetical protein
MSYTDYPVDFTKRRMNFPDNVDMQLNSALYCNVKIFPEIPNNYLGVRTIRPDSDDSMAYAKYVPQRLSDEQAKSWISQPIRKSYSINC